MRKVSLFRSTPFRLAVSFALLFMIAFLLAGLIVLEQLRVDLAERLDETVRSTFAVVAATYTDGDLEDVVASVNSHANLSTGDEQLFALVDASGKRLAGDFEASPVPAGFSTLSGADLRPIHENRYRVYSGAVGDNKLIVALSYSETEELETVMFTSFGWTLVIILGLAVVGGLVLATRVQGRLDAIGTTMMEISQGNLSARIPLSGRGDDIDQMSDDVNAALGRLSSLVEGMKQVSTNIAHDLKTPLNRLQIALELLGEKVARGAAVEADIVEVRIECQNINNTFEALLRIAQIEAGARKERFGQVSLTAIVTDIAEVYGDVADESGMSLAVDLTEGFGAAIIGDRQLLLQLCSNLVENAINHCPSGAHITFGLGPSGKGAAMWVADDGPGIAVTEREKVFQRLYRLEKSRTTPGSGLGLSLVKAIADLHGAEVTLEDNRPGLRVMVVFATAIVANA